MAAVVRVLVVWKTLKGLLLGAVAIDLSTRGSAAAASLTTLAANVSQISSWFGPLGHGLSAGPSPRAIAATAAISAVGAVVVLTEAIGLHFQRRWALWLTVAVSASLVPFELYQLFHKHEAGALGAIGLNLVVVGYLVRTTRRYTSQWTA